MQTWRRSGYCMHNWWGMASSSSSLVRRLTLEGNCRQLSAVRRGSRPRFLIDHRGLWRYSPSTKDQKHMRRTENYICDIVIRPTIIHWTSRAKFLDNRHNKCQLIALLKSTFEENDVFVEECKTNAETLVVMEALHAADHSVFEVSWIVKLIKNFITLYHFSYFTYV